MLYPRDCLPDHPCSPCWTLRCLLFSTLLHLRCFTLEIAFQTTHALHAGLFAAFFSAPSSIFDALPSRLPSRPPMLSMLDSSLPSFQHPPPSSMLYPRDCLPDHPCSPCWTLRCLLFSTLLHLRCFTLEIAFQTTHALHAGLFA